MKHKIFYSVLMVTSLTAAITVGSIMLLFFPFMENELLHELKEEARLIARGIDFNGVAYLDHFFRDERRITLINADGTVIFDSGTDVDKLDNHLDRQEIVQAIKIGEGSSIRFSDTLTRRTINYALKLKDGHLLRISINHNYILAMLSWLIAPTLIIVAAVFFLSAVLAGKVSDSVLKPLYDMDPESPGEAVIYEEIRPLTQKIMAQNRKLKEKIYQETEQKRQKQNEFTTNMTHELKTPLTSISGFAELMMNGGMDEETVRDFSKSIHDESARLIDIVDEIILIAELEERADEYEYTDVDLMDIAEDVKSRLEFSAGKKNIDIEISGEQAVVCGEQNILFEMVYNLCDNAIKYNVNGGNVNVFMNREKDGVHLTVKDSGIGIPIDEQSRIFERFYRVDKSHSKEIGGTGLGLSIVHQGAILHDATIQIKSREEQGTEISLIFPELKLTQS